MGALQGIGSPTPYATPSMLWGNPWSGVTQMGYPFAQQITPGLASMPVGGVSGVYGQQQLQPAVHQALQLLPQQLQQIQHSLLAVPQQLHQIQQLVQFVPHQLQQIQQLIQLLAQQSSQFQQPYGLQPFQIPSFGTSGWQTGQLQPFGGQPGYVM